MTTERIRESASRVLSSLLPPLILVVMLGITWFTWDHERQTAHQALRAQFEFSLHETVSRVEQRIGGYEQMLRGVQSLFATTALKNHKALNDYVEALQLDANFAGVQSMGVMHGADSADYAIDPIRRPALERARDSGMPAISGKARLVADTANHAPPAFVMYLPVYAPGLPHDTLEQRRANLIGWVYAAFRMNDFMASLYGGQSPGLALAIYDGTDPNETSLLYQSGGDNNALRAPSTRATIAANEYMVLAGHYWTLSLRTLEAFEDQYGRSAQNVIAVAGTVLSLLMALLAWQLVNGRERALHIASSMTDELRHMAQHDSLTGLPNRALFNDRLTQELARAKRHDGRFAMAFVDLDRFKSVNDNHGHDVGDHLLRQVATRLSDSFRDSDTVGRIGGDEFVALMADLSDRDTLLALAEKIRHAMRQPFIVNGLELNISCSIGIAVYPEDGSSADALTKSADEAMYSAKEAGRDCVRLCDPA